MRLWRRSERQRDVEEWNAEDFMNVNIELIGEQIRRLECKALQLKTSTERLIESLVQEFADEETETNFDTAAKYVLRKNRELYERLAQ